MSGLLRAKVPCAECPWRVDTPPGQFTAERYEILRGTTHDGGSGSAPFGAPMFACHKGRDDELFACAGWLASPGGGLMNVSVRLAAADGSLPPEALRPGEGWPELHATYDEMAAAKSAGRRTR